MSREVGAYIQLISEFQKPPSAPPARSEAGASGAVVGGCSPWMIMLDIVERDELDHGHSARTSLFLLFYASVGTAVAVAFLLCLARPCRPQTHAASIARWLANAIGGPCVHAAPHWPPHQACHVHARAEWLRPAERTRAPGEYGPGEKKRMDCRGSMTHLGFILLRRTGAHAVSAPPQVSRARPAAPTVPTQWQQLLQLLTPASAPPLPLCQYEDTRASANLQYGLALTCALQRTSKREDHRAQHPLCAPLQRCPPVTQVCAAHLRVHAALGTGVSAERSFSNAEHFEHGDKIPGLKASGIDIIAAQQAIKFARKWAVDNKSGPLLDFVACRYGGNSCVTRNLTLAGREIEGGRTSSTATKRASGIWFCAAIAQLF
ncbi:hypothetical protein FB451DRAFT_1366735 [Mycena latifolia]|nr:hypothetical protein FB451DRAFT_1366735 [Mycena latifolia]